MTKPNATLTEHLVARIKRLLLDKVPRKHIARQFGIGYEAVCRIARGETWREVWPEPTSGPMTEDQKLDAEFLGADEQIAAMKKRIEARLLASTPAEPIVTCPHCRAGVPKLGNGRHFIERLNMELDCG